MTEGNSKQMKVECVTCDNLGPDSKGRACCYSEQEMADVNPDGIRCGICSPPYCRDESIAGSIMPFDAL